MIMKNDKPFNNKIEFLDAIAQTLDKYPQSTSSYSENWLNNVKNQYCQNTGIKL